MTENQNKGATADDEWKDILLRGLNGQQEVGGPNSVDVCELCYKPVAKKINRRCSDVADVKVAWYCSVDHQRSHWPEHKRMECF
jgi:hypothetical protein